MAHWTTDPEYIELLNFLIETTKNVRSPINIYRLAFDFEISSGSSQPLSCLYSRICSAGQIICGLEGIDDHTKAKLLFALSVPVNIDFLEKLRESADVHLDHHRRIIKYKRNEDEFGISGSHGTAPKLSTNCENEPEFIELTNFLIEKTKDVKSPLSPWQLAADFIEINESFRTRSCISGRIQNMVRPRIHKMDQIDTDTKVKMMFALSAPINNDFLEFLKKQADVVLDDRRRIIEYRKHGGGLELNDFSVRKTEVETEKVIEFLAQKSIELNSPIPDLMFAREFKEKTGALQSVECLAYRFVAIKQKIYKHDGLDEKLKIRMLFVASARIPMDVLEELRMNALVEVDERNRITAYRANDGSLELEGDHSQSAKIITAKLESKQCYTKQIIDYFENKNEANDEMGRLIELITEKCENVSSPMSGHQLARDFENQFGIARSPRFLYDRTKGYCREIQKLEYLDTPTKVKQLFGLSASLSPEFLEKLQKDAVVEVDDRNRITEYAANDGSLILKGDHSHAAKSKKGYEEWRKSRNQRGDVNYNESAQSKRIRRSGIDPLDYYDLNSNVLPVPEVKLEPFCGSLIHGFAEMDDDIKVIPGLELREPKKEIEEAQTDFGTMEVPIKTEEDFIIPKLEELEEEDLKPEFTH